MQNWTWNVLAAYIADSVLNDKRQLIPVSACLDGQYGHSDVAIGVPAVIGKDGIHVIDA